MVAQQRSLSEALAHVTLYPQTLINVWLPQGFKWADHAPLAQAREAAQARLGDHGRILIRASGTEPVLRVMVEAADASLAASCAQAMADSLPRA